MKTAVDIARFSVSNFFRTVAPNVKLHYQNDFCAKFFIYDPTILFEACRFPFHVTISAGSVGLSMNVKIIIAQNHLNMANAPYVTRALFNYLFVLKIEHRIITVIPVIRVSLLHLLQ